MLLLDRSRVLISLFELTEPVCRRITNSMTWCPDIRSLFSHRTALHTCW